MGEDRWRLNVRVVIAGGGGMLGHKTWQVLRGRFDTWVTLRGSICDYPSGVFDPERTIEYVDADDGEAAAQAIARVRPDVIVNCVGIIKQRLEAQDPVASIRVNALFPHLLGRVARTIGARVIQISTDCIFSGRRGSYDEGDVPDANDLYGRSKMLGELGEPHLTIRSSLIGRELNGSHGLVEWFLGRRGTEVCGYRGAIFSGLTTLQMARTLARLVELGVPLAGTYHVAADPITKYDLLELLNDAFKVDAEVRGADEPRIDRSLDDRRFRDVTGIIAPTWPKMIRELAADAAPYENWRARV